MKVKKMKLALGSSLVDKVKQIPNAEFSLKRRWKKSVKYFNIILYNTIQNTNSQAAYKMFAYFMVSVQ